MKDSRRKLILILASLAIVLGCVDMLAQIQKKKTGKEKEQKETYTRPKPSRPIRPEIPSANRYQSDKVFLEKADSLYKKPSFRPEDEHQIVKGSVKFRQGGMFMYCDSAYYYPEINSLDAFGHVRMEQGDTLFAYADKLFYDGDARFARLRCGPSERKVRLKNRTVELLTDSLDYNLAADLGWYEYGGQLKDELNTLTSIYGEYSPASKDATFYHDVVLVNHKDNSTMLTDTLFYNTDTNIARIVSPTKIISPHDTILTDKGIYNTRTENAELLSRSIITHTDSLGRATILEGDSIIYDKAARLSRAYMFNGVGKLGRPMVITDTTRKVVLTGSYGQYNDSTREAFATGYPLMIEYSRGDSLFLRADTIKSIIETRKVWPANVMAEWRERKKMFADSVAKAAEIADSASIELVESGIKEADTKGQKEKDEKAKNKDKGTGILQGIERNSKSAEGAVAMAQTGAEMEAPSDSPMDRGNSSPVGASHEEMPDSALMVDREFHVAKAYNRARFFRPDLQGVADSMIYLEYDSMLYMIRKPILWNTTRQVVGNEIRIHFNDSTADKAYLPDYGMIAELVEEDFYNQLAGKKMTATLENEQLKNLYVDGNVQAIFLPAEEDSTYNKLVYAESATLSADFAGREIEYLKMWPEVTGNVTPLFQVKENRKYLQGFQWYEPIRPKREWYGNRWHWADDLGEIPEELDLYFKMGDNGLMNTGRRRLQKGATPQPVAASSAEAAKSVAASESVESVAASSSAGEEAEEAVEEVKK